MPRKTFNFLEAKFAEWDQRDRGEISFQMGEGALTWVWFNVETREVKQSGYFWRKATEREIASALAYMLMYDIAIGVPF